MPTELTIQPALSLAVPGERFRPAIDLFQRNLSGPLSESSVRSFLDDLRSGQIKQDNGEPYRPATVARYIADLKAVIGQTSDSVQFRASLDALFKRAAPKVEKRIHRSETLTPAEVRKLEQATDERTAAALRFLALSGMRISEALSIRLSDCKTDRKEVAIRITGKGRKERTVSVTREAFDAVRQSFDSKEYLFQNHHHRSRDGRFTRQRWYQIVRAAGERALDRRIHPHTFRHATATNLLAAGNTLKAVAGHLGHARVSTTAEIYDENTLAFQAIEQLEKAINAS